MTILFLILVLILVCLLLLIGLISPKVGLFWYKGKRTRIKVLGIYALFAVILFSAISIIGREPNPEFKDAFNEYYLNQPRAHLRYDGKQFTTFGLVEQVVFDTTSNKTFVFVNVEYLKQYMCYFTNEEKASALKPGNYVEFKGTFSIPIGMGIPTFNDCEFIEVKDKADKATSPIAEYNDFNFEALDTISTFNLIEGYTPSVSSRDFALTIQNTDSMNIHNAFWNKEMNIQGPIYNIMWNEFEGAFTVELYGYRKSNVICLFHNIDDILNLNIGETITVKGKFVKQYWPTISEDEDMIPVEIYIENCSVVK